MRKARRPGGARSRQSGAPARSAPPARPPTPAIARRHLTLPERNNGSVRSCLATARDNARAARTALTVEVWEAINRAWRIIRDRIKPGGVQQSLNLMDSLKAEIRGFEGALRRMLRAEGCWFMQLGAAIERGDNTARLLHGKYYLLPPTGTDAGGAV